jgi:hypothetical protein
MRSSSELYKLIHSLSMSEKRHFKLYASRHIIGKENLYVRLFNVIDKLNDYDEEKAKAFFKGTPFLTQFAAQKIYLYNLILKSLRIYHSSSSINLEVKELLVHAELLFNRALHASCKKILLKAKKLTYQYDLYPLLLDILKWEKLLVTLAEQVGIRKNLLRDIMQEEKEVLHRSDILHRYENIYRPIFEIRITSGFSRSREDRQRLKKIIVQPLMKNEDNAYFFAAKNLYHASLYTYYLLNGNDVGSYKQSKKNLALLESRHDRIIEFPHNYLSIYNNYLTGCLKVERYEEHRYGLVNLKKMRKVILKKRSEQVEVTLFGILVNQELDSCLRTGEFDNAVNSVGWIKSGLLKYKGKLPATTEKGIYYNIANNYFGIEMFHESLYWINKLLNAPLAIQEDVYCFAKIIQLMIMFEKQDTDGLAYTIPSIAFYQKETGCIKRNRLSWILSGIKFPW